MARNRDGEEPGWGGTVIGRIVKRIIKLYYYKDLIN